MSDKLKQYVQRNQEDFELYPFDVAHGWSEIAPKIKQKTKTVPLRIWYSIAASVLILLAGWVGFRSTSGTGDTFPAELQEAQFYYQDMIDAKINLVRNQVSDPQLLQDIEALDVAFTELSEDLRDDVHNEEVITAMIDNYRLKLKILERILEDLEDKSNEENRGI